MRRAGYTTTIDLPTSVERSFPSQSNQLGIRSNNPMVSFNDIKEEIKETESVYDKASPKAVL